MNSYIVGQQVRLKATFTDPVGDPVAPTSVTFRTKNGSGPEVTYDSPASDALGEYHQDILLTVSGVWRWRVEGAGAAIGANESSFRVQTTVFD